MEKKSVNCQKHADQENWSRKLAIKIRAAIYRKIRQEKEDSGAEVLRRQEVAKWKQVKDE